MIGGRLLPHRVGQFSSSFHSSNCYRWLAMLSLSTFRFLRSVSHIFRFRQTQMIPCWNNRRARARETISTCILSLSLWAHNRHQSVIGTSNDPIVLDFVCYDFFFLCFFVCSVFLSLHLFPWAHIVGPTPTAAKEILCEGKERRGKKKSQPNDCTQFLSVNFVFRLSSQLQTHTHIRYSN